MPGVSGSELAARYPFAWHMAEAGTWESIRRHGLRSTSSLLDLYGVTGLERNRIESTHRPSATRLSAPGLPDAIVRDQAPMNERVLASVLDDGLSPRDWYRILNARVFFWVSHDRLERLLGGRLYRSRPHTVITADTGRLLALHQDRITLSPINSGNTMMVAMRRGLRTFLPLNAYPFHERRSARKEPVAEVAVNGLVPDIESIVVRVEERQAGADPRIVYTT